MKIRTDFVTNSSSSSYCVSIGILTEDGKMYDLRVDPDDMCSSGGNSNIFLKGDKYESITNAKDIEELYNLIWDTVNMENVFYDEEELAWIECERYDMEDESDFYAEELKKAKTVIEKIQVIAKIKDDFYEEWIKEIESSDKTSKEKEIKKVQKEREQDQISGFAELSSKIEAFKKQITNELSSIEQVKEVNLSQIHYAWGEFAAESFRRIVGNICDDNASCEGITFALSKKLSRNKQIKDFIEKRAGVISSRMNKDVNYLIADEDDETDTKIAKAKELSVPIISTRELYEKFDLELDPSDDRVLTRLKEEFAEGSDFKGIISALGCEGPCQLSDSFDVSIDMKTGNIKKSHIIDDCN